MNRTPSTPLAFARRTLLTALILLAAAAAVAVAFGGMRIAASLAAGSGIAMASFAVLVFVIVRSASGAGGAAWVALLGVIKMGFLGAIIWWLLRRGLVDPLAFMGGFSTMVAALLIEGVRHR